MISTGFSLAATAERVAMGDVLGAGHMWDTGYVLFFELGNRYTGACFSFLFFFFFFFEITSLYLLIKWFLTTIKFCIGGSMLNAQSLIHLKPNSRQFPLF